MRVLLAILALLLIGAKPAPNWLDTLAPTAAGGFVMGNPRAKVKLVEYASLTCPHCRDFHLAASPALGPNYIAKGLVSYELRIFVLNGPDTAAAMLARCEGPRRFFRLADVFFRQQSTWVQPFTTITPAEQTRLQALPQDKQLAGLALAGKLDQFVSRHGMTRARAAQCLANTALYDQLEALRARGTKDGVQGTPTFFINGAKASANDWGSLEPQIRQALN